MDPDAGRNRYPSVPGYEVTREIGRGGFATVYEARQTSVDRLVALKVISTGSLSPVTERRFRDELRAVGGLSWHPHVVGVHDGGLTEDGRPFLSMELVTGGSWGERVRADGPLTPGRVARLGAEVADALHAAHEATVVHRDIKPDNVLVGRRDDALLTDFGIATLADATMTATGTFVGTVAYSPPELLRGERATPLSDVYSLGALLWTLAVGHAAYDTSDDETPVASVMRVMGSPPQALPASVPPELAAVIERAMARAPHDRFPSAEAVREALVPLAEPSRAGAVTTDPSPIDPTTVTPRPAAAVAPPSLEKAEPTSADPAAATVAPAAAPPDLTKPPVEPTPAPASMWEVPGPAGDPSPFTPGPFAAPPAPPPAAWSPQAPPPAPGPWAPPAPTWGAPPQPAWGATPGWPPPPESSKTSGLAVAGLILSVVCCVPVGLGLTIAGHVQIRRGNRSGKALVWIGYAAAVLVTLGGIAFFALGATVLQDQNDRFEGSWESTSEIDDEVDLELRAETGGLLIGGSFEAEQDGSACRGRVEEAGSSEAGRLELDLIGSCDDGQRYDRSLDLSLTNDDTEMVDVTDGTRFRRTDG